MDRRFRGENPRHRQRGYSESDSGFPAYRERHRRSSRQYERYDELYDERYDERYDDRGITSEAEPRRKPPPKREWPPQFESAGGSYVFDARSGFFYETSSDFFYDPKTKLYYGNKQKKYFEHCPDEQPPYRPVSEPKGETDSTSSEMKNEASDTEAKVNLQNDSSDMPANISKECKPALLDLKKTTLGRGIKTEKRKIVISIKKKKSNLNPSLSRSNDNELPEAEAADNLNSVTSSLPSHVHKQHAVDIQKWSVRGREMRNDSAVVSCSPALSQQSQSESGAIKASTSEPKPSDNHPKEALPTVAKTTTGKPVCLLCKRKFGDMVKLKQHIDFSALHKQNIARKVAEDERKKSSSPTEYRDRAKERRGMYGPNIQPVKNTIVETATGLPGLPVLVVGQPNDNLGDSNIGNQMLKKLGWKNGETLGDEKNNVVGKKLREDWEQIERLARVNGKMSIGRS